MRKIALVMIIASLLAMIAMACGCGTEESMDRDDEVVTTQDGILDLDRTGDGTGYDTRDGTRDGDSTTQNGEGDLEPGPNYDPYPTPGPGEMVTPTDYDVGLREGYEGGYWAGLADGMRGIYGEAEPGLYDDSNEYYVEGYLEGYFEGYEDGYSDGEAM